MSELARLQQQFYAYVTKGTPLDGVIASGDPQVYARMYASRLHDALVEDYPKLRAALGDDEFAALAYRYFQARPPRSFTLRDAGVDLSTYLRDADAAPGLWLSQLAALERARVEAFDGRDAVALAQDDVAALGDALPDLILRWVPTSSVVRLTWNVDDMWSAIEDAAQPVAPAMLDGTILDGTTSRTVLVWRRDTTVVHRTLDADEGELAPQLIAGASFAEICEVLAMHHGDQAAPRAVELLLRWLQGEALASLS